MNTNINLIKRIFMIVTLCLASTFLYAKDKEVFVLGIPPWGGNNTEIIEKFIPLTKYLEEVLDKKVEFQISSDYDTLGEEINSGKVDVAILSSSAYVKAKNKFSKIRYLCTPIEKKTGKPSYSSYIIAKKESGMLSYKDLKDKCFAFVDESSSSGYKFPLALILSKWKIVPEKYYKKILFLGTHPNVLEAVLSGQADGGALSSNYIDDLDEIQREKIVVLEKIEKIPFDGVIVSPYLKDEFVIKLKKALLGINKKTKTLENILVEEKLPWAGFVEMDDGFYNIVRETEKSIGNYKTK